MKIYKRVHFIAIGGSVMHSLAIAMKRLGSEVSGSDDALFEPSRSKLAEHGLLPETGWNDSKITKNIDLVILGMHAHTDNPELIKAQQLGLLIMSFPELIYQLSRDKLRIVIAGSHGKTTISAILVHVLSALKIDFDYALGAQVPGLDSAARFSESDIVVIEGDEYLSSRIDPRSKFLHYHPDILILTGIAWDHINVFPTFKSYVTCFDTLLKDLAESSQVIFYRHDKVLTDLVVKNRIDNSSSYESIGSNRKQEIEIDGQTEETHIFGEHNMQNLSAAWEVCKRIGIQADQFLEAQKTFVGASKRLEAIGPINSNILLDYAHAPSKVKATVRAVRNQFKGSHLVCIFELHTYSSMNPEFLPQYEDCFEGANETLIYYDLESVKIKRRPLMSDNLIQKSIGQKTAKIIRHSEQLRSVLESIDLKTSVILLMSSGNFGGFKVREWAKDL